MKVSKVFGLVLSLHLGVIAVLIVQPGCSTRQPPTQSYQQQATLGTAAPASVDDLIPAPQEGALDAAFNAGLGEGGVEQTTRQEPTRPVEAFNALAGEMDPTPTVDIAGPSYETYTVQKGDSLWAISRRKGVALNDIYAANGLNEKSVLKIGQEIKLPVEGSTAVIQTEVAAPYQPAAYAATTTYKVSAGDTLTRIANKFDTTVGAIKAANGKTSDLIRLNETLIIPVSGEAAAAPAGVIEPAAAVSEPQVAPATAPAAPPAPSAPAPVVVEPSVEMNVVATEAVVEEPPVAMDAEALFESAEKIPVVNAAAE